MLDAEFFDKLENIAKDICGNNNLFGGILV